jgi:hypothetical protein
MDSNICTPVFIACVNYKSQKVDTTQMATDGQMEKQNDECIQWNIICPFGNKSGHVYLGLNVHVPSKLIF